MTNLILKSNKDLYDAYSLSYESIDWLAVLLRQIEKEIKYIRNEVDQKESDNSCFHDLEKLIAIASFTADEQLEHFDSIKSRFKNALEQSKTPIPECTTHTTDEVKKTNKKAVIL